MFRYKRLSFGVNAAAEKIQDVIASAISDIPNVKNISDDVILYGVNTQGHDKTLDVVLIRFKKLNLSPPKDKGRFYMPRIKVFGMVFNGQAMSSDFANIETIQKADVRSSVSDVLSVLGMTNYVPPSKRTVPLVDASPVGLGAELTQGGTVISFGSKALSSVERRYSQIEREALTIVWSCHHFRMHRLGSHCNV